MGRTAIGKERKSALRPAKGRPEGRFRCFPGSSPAKIQPGRPIYSTEALLRNIEQTRDLGVLRVLAVVLAPTSQEDPDLGYSYGVRGWLWEVTLCYAAAAAARSMNPNDPWLKKYNRGGEAVPLAAAPPLGARRPRTKCKTKSVAILAQASREKVSGQLGNSNPSRCVGHEVCFVVLLLFLRVVA